MSNRTSMANKAVREAWENERALIKNGKCTRDWSIEQQRDILDRGKAYDENGRAFEGQHMKSVEEYPEYQGNPNNIQFLTRDEHLKAHNGDWKNSTNWYFDPITEAKLDFGDGFIPCEIMPLSNPILALEATTRIETSTSDENNRPLINTGKGSILKPFSQKSSSSAKLAKTKIAQKGGKVLSFIKNNRVKIIGAAIAASFGAVVTIRENFCKKYYPDFNEEFQYDQFSPEFENQANSSQTYERNTPSENIVSAHSQRYHTNNGIVLKSKEPYARGRSDSNAPN